MVLCLSLSLVPPPRKPNTDEIRESSSVLLKVDSSSPVAKLAGTAGTRRSPTPSPTSARFFMACLPSAVATAASDSSCRGEAVEVGGELEDIDDKAEFFGELDSGAVM
ncbi:unnamed protein product [Urochloa humidicola]